MACGKAGKEKGHADHLCFSCGRSYRHNGVCAVLCMDGGECLFEAVESETRPLVRREGEYDED